MKFWYGNIILCFVHVAINNFVIHVCLSNNFCKLADFFFDKNVYDATRLIGIWGRP